MNGDGDTLMNFQYVQQLLVSIGRLLQGAFTNWMLRLKAIMS